MRLKLDHALLHFTSNFLLVARKVVGIYRASYTIIFYYGRFHILTEHLRRNRRAAGNRYFQNPQGLRRLATGLDEAVMQ